MLKLFSLLVFSFTSFAQSIKPPEYVSLAHSKVYDVEIIVFAYNKALPNSYTYTNKAIYDNADALILGKLQDNLALTKGHKSVTNSTQYSMPIDENENTKQVLVWFEHNKEDHKLNDIWNKLQQQQGIIPILHRAWRQPETPFENPQYIQISTVNIPISGSTKTNNYPNNALMGKVALSKGRFLHFGHKLNLFKQLQNNGQSNSMVFSLTERKQVHTTDLHYFDSPWFGSIIKITQFKGD